MSVPIYSNITTPYTNLRGGGHQLVRPGASTVGSFPSPYIVASDTAGDGIVGNAYSTTFVAAAGVSPYTFASSGSLPSGLSLNSSTGVLSGTPSAAGSFSFTISATDARGAVASQPFSVTIFTVTQVGGGTGFARVFAGY